MRHWKMIFALACLSIGACEMGTNEPALGTSTGQPLVVQLDPSTTPNLGLNGGQASGDPIRVNVTSNSSDASYRTEWTVGAGQCLRVVRRDGQEVVHSGDNIVAHYYHFGHMLGVTVGPTDNPLLFSYIDPVTWSTGACPAS